VRAIGGVTKTAGLFHGAMVSTMIVMLASALSISRCTVSTSDFGLLQFLEFGF
jgi:hypothetical protein